MKVLILLVGLNALISCSTRPLPLNDKRWYKGNTHAHTNETDHGDGVTTPLLAAKWYHDQGYHFLTLSEHNHFIDPEKVRAADKDKVLHRDDFILIPGLEVTGKKLIHTTSFNTHGHVDAGRHHHHHSKQEIVQYHVDRVREKKGEPILNHPNFGWALNFDDIKDVKRLHLFELFNGHHLVNNEGAPGKDSTEQLWDKLLSSGMRIFGVSSDDAHNYQNFDHRKHSNPGRGWIMVRASELSSKSITKAIAKGDFYASNGVTLSECEVKDGVYRVKVDMDATKKVVSKEYVHGLSVAREEASTVVSFIGTGGKVLERVNGAQAEFALEGVAGYVRARVDMTVKKNGKWQMFRAWGQPNFSN